MILIICNSWFAHAAYVRVSDEAHVLPGAGQLNVNDLYGQDRVKIVRRSVESVWGGGR